MKNYMQKREANFTLTFRHWLKAHPMPVSAAFELKQTTLNMIPFSVVEEHQIEALRAVQTESGLLYKAPDDSRGYKPFDLFYLRRSPGFVVIKFRAEFCIISVDAFTLERGSSERKSLTVARAREIAVKTVPL